MDKEYRDYMNISTMARKVGMTTAGLMHYQNNLKLIKPEAMVGNMGLYTNKTLTLVRKIRRNSKRRPHGLSLVKIMKRKGEL